VPATPVLVRVPPELLERVDEAVARLRADGWTGTRTALILDAIRDYLTPSIRTR
jgi:metal-responsive CopG/Arc/MetJ family transcriptional regulator